MKTVFIHGLGQNASAWDKVLHYMGEESADAVCPNLFSLTDAEMTYKNVYEAFSRYMGEFTEPVKLCGLSLGAVLALNYAMDNPEKVHSMVLIGARYKMPAKMIKMQNMVFKLMPKSLFGEMGVKKEDCIGLTNSMTDIDFTDRLSEVSCPVLIICGEKDAANKAAAYEMKDKIAGAELEEIFGVGHEINTHDPEKLIELMNDFYKRS